MFAEEYSPFLRFVGIEDLQSQDGVGVSALDVEPQHLQAAGRVHGGLLAVLADTACYRAVRSVLGPGEGTTTIELKMNYLEGTDSGRLTATARVISNRDRLVVADVEVAGSDGRIVAQGLSTYLIFAD